MSKYTTGEMAKLCGVSVRTVQYYDSRGILVPSTLSEGGRRLYSDGDLGKLKVICFLRSLDLSISAIGELFSEEDPESVISLLLDQQERTLKEEIGDRQEKLQKLQHLKQDIPKIEHFSVESIGDIAYMMENRKKMYRVRMGMIAVGLVMDAIEIGTLLLWIFKGIWWPFAAGMPLVIGMGVWVSRFYLKNTAFICPKCHTVFKPRFKEAFFAYHTTSARRLTCPHCGHHGFCVETYGRETEKNGQG